MDKNYEKYIKLIPIGGLLIVLLSSIKLVIFYRYFNINIVDYIDIDEYATLFIDDFLYYVLFFGIGLILGFLNLKNKTTNGNIRNIDFSKYKKQRFLILIFIFLMGILLSYFIYKAENEIERLKLFKSSTYYLLMILYVYFSLTKFNFEYLTVIFIAIFLYNIFDSNIDAKKIIHSEPKLKYIINYKTECFETNNEIRYVGKTDKFIFLYDIIKKKTLVLSNKNLEKIIIEEIE